MSDMDKREARQRLQSIADAQAVVARGSQNNGTVLLVWGFTVLAAMSGFDLAPALAARWFGADGAPLYGPALAALFMLPLVMGASAWTQLYVRGLPVAARAPGNRWLFVKQSRGGLLTYGSGWWAAYHVAVLGAGMAAVFWTMHAMHRAIAPPFAFTLIGLIDAAPLLAIGWRQRRDCN